MYVHTGFVCGCMVGESIYSINLGVILYHVSCRLYILESKSFWYQNERLILICYRLLQLPVVFVDWSSLLPVCTWWDERHPLRWSPCNRIISLLRKPFRPVRCSQLDCIFISIFAFWEYIFVWWCLELLVKFYYVFLHRWTSSLRMQKCSNFLLTFSFFL